MSKYTTELRFICETSAGLTDSEGYTSTRDIIEKSRAKIFDFDYPIFDEKYRSVLETKIIKHYYTREIAAETVGLWKLWLDERMNNIMPYYNQLYKSELLEFNPLYDTDITTDSNRKEKHEENTTDNNVRTDNTSRDENGTETRTDNLSSKNTRTDDLKTNSTRTDDLKTSNEHEDSDKDSGTNDSLQAYSDTPQNGLKGVTELNYLTNATKNTGSDSKTHNNNGSYTNKSTGTQDNDTTQTGTQVNDATQTGTVRNDINNTVRNTGTVSDSGTGTKNYDNVNDYLEHVKGKRGTESYAKMLQEYRKTFLNIDQMVINSLSDLFMGVW